MPKQNSITRMTTAKQLASRARHNLVARNAKIASRIVVDYRNRFLAISSTASGAGQAPVSFNFAYNMANQRARASISDGTARVQNYDQRAQVASGKMAWSDDR